MFTLFKRLFRRQPDPLSAPQFRGASDTAGTGLDVYQGDEEDGDYAITRYPPFDKGIPVIAVEKILLTQRDLIDRIFRTAGVSRDDFARLYRQPIENLARHVHLLPATSTTYFRGTGGLFRMSLEIGLNALQSANAAVFPTGGGVERRFSMQPKWTLATFLAGLCSQNYRTVNSMAVLTRNNAQWTPLLDPLYGWCQQTQTDVYFVRWMDEGQVRGAQASAAYSISQVVPHAVLQYLASDNNQVIPAMTAAIAGVEINTSENPISRLVAPVITRVIEDDLKRSATNYGHLVIGAHLEMHLVDAMRRLVRGGKWIPNNVASGGRVWVGQEGVFIDWQVAANDIATLLARDSFAGIPKDPDTLADLLVSANLLQLTKNGGRYWTIALPVTMESKEGMVKLRDGPVIFPQGFQFAPFENVQLTLSITPSARAPAKGVVQNESGTSESTPVHNLEPPVNAMQDASEQAEASKANVEDGSPSAAATRASTQAPPVDSEAPREAVRAEDTRTQPVTTAGPQVRRPGKKAAKAEQQVTAQSPAQTIEKHGHEEATTVAAKPLPTAVSVATGNSATAEKLLGTMTRTNAWLLQEVLNAYRKGTLTGPVAVLPQGLGISHEELNGHGIPVMELLEELARKSWLWQDKTRAMRRIHAVEYDGKTQRMVILKPDIAAALGFDMQRKD